MNSLLRVDDLEVALPTPAGLVRAINGLSFEINEGEAVGLVGESGCGKSLTALALLGLLPERAQVRGRAHFQQQDLLTLSAAEKTKMRGSQIALVFQDPMTALNPHLSIARQMSEVLEVHRGASSQEAVVECRRMLDAVQIADAAAVLKRYPHELSGGQRQRVMIATALLCRPRLLIADEPTTALDVTVQAQILGLFAQLRRDFSLTLLLISHDLGVVAEVCSRVLVVYAGRLVEQGATAAVLARPQHPYTRALMDARPRLEGAAVTTLKTITGQPPDARQLPPGCAFEPRCPRSAEPCRRSPPPMEIAANGHSWACYHPLD
ncbi:MAG: ABC transporter ATP-binding protein [Pseudomonadota bacterium]